MVRSWRAWSCPRTCARRCDRADINFHPYFPPDAFLPLNGITFFLVGWFMAASICIVITSAAALVGLVSRWAYRSVVVLFVLPNNFPMIARPRPATLAMSPQISVRVQVDAIK